MPLPSVSRPQTTGASQPLAAVVLTWLIEVKQVMWLRVASRSGEMDVIQRQGLQGQKQGTLDTHGGAAGGAICSPYEFCWGGESRHSILSTPWDPEGLLLPAGQALGRKPRDEDT